MKINNIHYSIANYIKKNKTTQKILLGIEKNPAMYNSFICAGIGVFAKPATLLLLPTKDKEMKKDSRYGIARSISTGLIDFAFGLCLFLPLNKRIDKVGRNLYNTKGSIYYKNKDMTTNAKSILNRGLRFLSLPLFAVMKFGILDKTVKILFGKDEDKNEK